MLPVRTSNPSPIPILTYHQIDAAPAKGAPFRSLYVSPAAFSRQMGLLKMLGYRGLSMSALQPYLRGERAGKVVGITLDDGYLNNLTHALPVLKRHGFSSTCYVVSQRVGKTNEWDLHKGIAQSPLMDAVQLRQWVDGGQEVGAHTRHHADLTQIGAVMARDEIFKSKEELEEVIGQPVTQFCYPYGTFSDEHAELVREAGFSCATTTVRSRCLTHEDFMKLPRAPVVRSTRLFGLWQKVATAYEDRRRLSQLTATNP
jgi:peptidoglycan/xylan/chitin deacetylase (PgdA/CDA1 family)